MEYAIEVLRHAETVLVKKLKVMKDGKPKYATSAKISELRDAISILSQYDEGMTEMDEEELAEAFAQYPPTAQA